MNRTDHLPRRCCWATLPIALVRGFNGIQTIVPEEGNWNAGQFSWDYEEKHYTAMQPSGLSKLKIFPNLWSNSDTIYTSPVSC